MLCQEAIGLQPIVQFKLKKLYKIVIRYYMDLKCQYVKILQATPE